ncbi:adenylyl-sulfate kinase [Paenibacillus sp. SYP-B4298]|uniref:adenylyl-sulfate kinase n=1 Tax=Paenibacillus sp. SYP-B4298 TaxID=2996034 RepID=UPI0022DCE435|nr:adenylyl-sulfate kinase [Paenibacillus sp. SYP-B4298]
MSSQGRVYWITGLAGAGKTSISKLLYAKLREQRDGVVLLDGDMLREAFGHDLGYSRADRYTNAMRYARLCRMLSEQGLDVVCATISMFHDCRAWNRKSIADYCEVYVRVSAATLMERNQKGLYAATGEGQKQARNVVGLDQAFEEPLQPDLVVDNDGQTPLEAIVAQIMQLP